MPKRHYSKIQIIAAAILFCVMHTVAHAAPMFCRDGNAEGGSILAYGESCLCSGCPDGNSFITNDIGACAANKCTVNRCADGREKNPNRPEKSRKKLTKNACDIAQAWVEEQIKKGAAGEPTGCAEGCTACEPGIYAEAIQGATMCTVSYTRPCVKSYRPCPKPIAPDPRKPSGAVTSSDTHSTPIDSAS